MEYLLILFLFFLVTLFLEHKYRVHLYHNRRERFLVVTFFFLVGVLWDSFAVWRGHWAFPVGKTLNIRIGLLPIEEYLFFLIVPFFTLTVYKIMDVKLSKRR